MVQLDIDSTAQGKKSPALSGMMEGSGEPRKGNTDGRGMRTGDPQCRLQPSPFGKSDSLKNDFVRGTVHRKFLRTSAKMVSR